MKKFLAVMLCAFATLCFSAHGQSTANRAYLTNDAGWYDFAAVTATGATPYVDIRAILPRTHTIEASVSGSPSACTFNVQASSNANNWYDISGTQTCTSSMMFHIADKPVRYLRINVLSLTGTATLTFQWTGTR